MNTTIESIMKASEKGCIDSWNDIGRIVGRLAATPVALLRGGYTDTILSVLHDFMEDNGMDHERCREVTFSEALCMLSSISSCGVYAGNGEDWCWKTCITLLGHFRSVLISAQMSEPTLQLFMAISVSGYFSYLSMKSGRKGKDIRKAFRCYKKCIEHDIGFTMKNTTTIKELLEALDQYQRRPWLPRQPVQEYANEMISSYTELYSFFVGLYSQAFPEYFDLNELKNKYMEDNNG